MAELLRIALVMGRADGHSRGVLRGARMYSLGRPWICCQADPSDVEISRLSAWSPDGVICDAGNAHYAPGLPGGHDAAAASHGSGVGETALAQRLSAALGVPVVDVTLGCGRWAQARICCDCGAAGELAAQHFLERGFHHFAFAGCSNSACSGQCLQGFARVVRGMDYALASTCDIAAGGDLWQMCRCAEHDRRLSAWLAALPRPVGVMTCSDVVGIMAAEAARAASLRVPEDVAIVGFGDDELLCELASPPLSSVKIPSERMGYEAAALLERLLAGNPAPAAPVTLPPIGVVARASSDLMPFADPVLAAAVRFIRQHAHEGIGVTDVLRQVSVSRRSLERRFRDTLHRSPLDEIKRARIQRARELLGGTDLSLPAVARGAGFANAQWFSVVFRKETGLAPMMYRRQFRIVRPGCD